MIEAKLERTGLFMSLITIYADASEALHGTIYGAVFHLGAYNIGSVPTDQESLDRHRHATLCCLYLMTGGAIDTLISLLSFIGEPYALAVEAESKSDFKKTAVEVGLAATKKEI